MFHHLSLTLMLCKQIANEQMAIAKVEAERKGRIPLSVCHQLEQCIREVEVRDELEIMNNYRSRLTANQFQIEVQKEQRRRDKLNKEVSELTQEIERIFRSHGYTDSAR